MTLPTATPVPPGGQETEDDETTNRGFAIPLVTISRVRPSVVEGGEVRFVLTADVAYSETLYVNVDVTQDGSFLTGTIPSVITIVSGTRTSYLILQTDDDNTEEDDGWVHAEVENGSNYLLGDTTTSSVRVWDNETVTINIYQNDLSVTEGKFLFLPGNGRPHPGLQAAHKGERHRDRGLLGDSNHRTRVRPWRGHHLLHPDHGGR